MKIGWANDQLYSSILWNLHSFGCVTRMRDSDARLGCVTRMCDSDARLGCVTRMCDSDA
jgi:hypothetical protein